VEFRRYFLFAGKLKEAREGSKEGRKRARGSKRRKEEEKLKAWRCISN